MLNTFKVAAELGPESLSAYVISMATNASDVLAVELLKREASLVVSQPSSYISYCHTSLYCIFPMLGAHSLGGMSPGLVILIRAVYTKQLCAVQIARKMTRWCA